MYIVYHVFLCGAIISRFVANLEKCRDYAFLGGYANIITILQKGGLPNILQYLKRGLPNLIQYNMVGEGSLGKVKALLEKGFISYVGKNVVECSG